MLPTDFIISFPVVEYLAGITFSENAIPMSLQYASPGICRSVVCLTSIINENSTNRHKSCHVEDGIDQLIPVVEYLAGITFSKNAIAVSLACSSLGIYRSLVYLTSIIGELVGQRHYHVEDRFHHLNPND
jgi:hypothetical protein